jgi:hypothetical protein
LKPENKFRVWFEEKARGYLAQRYPSLPVRFQKHADAVTAGIADMDLSIGGTTIWLEFKLLTSCHKERKLYVTPLQHEFLRAVAQAGVGSGLLVGLALGPRKGYDVALYHTTIPTVAHRNEFRPWTLVVDELLSMATARAAQSHYLLSQVESPRPHRVGNLPLFALASMPDLDDACEDGG